MKRIISIITIFISLTYLSATNFKVGDKIPDFKMLLDDGTKTNLYSFLNKGNTIVLYFYPKDGTSGCTAQAENIRDNIDKLAKRNVVVFGISTDDLLSHQNFKKKHKLNFYLISDYDQSISKMFGVLGFLGFSQRVTFILNPDGTIKHIIKDVDTKRHTDQILLAL